MFAIALAAGWSIDALPLEAFSPLHDESDAHANEALSAVECLQWSCLAAMTLVGLASLFRLGPRGMVQRVLGATHLH